MTATFSSRLSATPSIRTPKIRKDWNDGTIEENTDKMSTYYRSIILAGPE